MPGLTLLHTNDLHARLDQFTRLAALIQRERARVNAAGRAGLLLDAGDSASSEVWESDVTGGRANYAMLEAMGYTAAALGNSDLQWGRAAALKLAGAVHFPVLAANLRDSGTGSPLPGVKPYTIFKFDSLSVGVAGLLTPEDMHPDFRVAHPAETLRALVPQMQSEGMQCLIVLSHLGLEADRRLAAEVPGIHVVVGGHTHTLLPAPGYVGQTAIVQAGEFGNFLGRLDLEYDDASRAVTVTGHELLPCPASTPPDPTLAGMLELVRFEAAVVRKKRGESGG